MTASAVVMMLVAVLVLWGGLALAVANLVRQGRSAPQDTEPGR